MDRLSDNATKADELAHWRAFLATLPAHTYLGLYLAGSDAVLEHYMRDDVSCELIPEIRRGRNDALEDAARANAQRKRAIEERDRLHREVRELRAEAVRLREELQDLARAACTLSRQAADAHAKAVATVVTSLQKAV
jgi:hypothetical protein